MIFNLFSVFEDKIGFMAFRLLTKCGFCFLKPSHRNECYLTSRFPKISAFQICSSRALKVKKQCPAPDASKYVCCIGARFVSKAL